MHPHCSMFFQCFYSACNSSSSCSFWSSCNFCHYRRSCSRYLFYIQVFCELSTLFGKRWEWEDSLSALLQGWWANKGWILFFLQTSYFSGQKESDVRTCLDFLWGGSVQQEEPIVTTIWVPWCQCESYHQRRANTYILVQSAIRNKTIKSLFHMPSELPLLVSTLEVVSDTFAPMSDSDDEECPELVEEVLGKVRKYIS